MSLLKSDSPKYSQTGLSLLQLLLLLGVIGVVVTVVANQFI